MLSVMIFKYGCNTQINIVGIPNALCKEYSVTSVAMHAHETIMFIKYVVIFWQRNIRISFSLI